MANVFFGIPGVAHPVALAGAGVSYASMVSGSTPFDPSQIPNLTVMLWNKIGNVYTDNPPTVPATAGQAVAASKGQYGTSVNATQGTALLQPTARTDGLEFDALGLKSLATADQALTALTIYCGGNIDSGSSNYIAYANSGGTTGLIGVFSGVPTLVDDNQENVLQTASPASGPTLIRANVTSAGAESLIATGNTEATGSVSPGAPFTFNNIAVSGGASAGNDSAANRYLLLMVIARSIVLGSAEDLQIRQWIDDNLNLSL